MGRTPRKSKGTWTRDNHSILGDKGQIYRVNASGDVYQLRMWIPQEKKYLRKSLKTRDFETAKKRAEEIIFQTFSDVQSGRKIFGSSLKELITAFLEWRWKDVEGGIITKGRHSTLITQTNRILEFKSGDLKLAELDSNSFYDWEQWRKKEYNAKSVTIRNEQSTINQMMEFGYREGFCHFQKFEFRKIKISRDDIGRRDIFTLKEYDKLVRFLRSYTSVKECPDKYQRLERLMVRDCVLIASNTMLRVGELWGLEWRDVVSIEKTKDALDKDIHLATINIRPEISKVRTSRRIITRGGEYLERLKKNSTHTAPDNHLFCAIGGTTPLDRKKWYLHWKNLMNGIGIENYKERQLTWYSLRHFGITCRIRAKVPYLEISKIAGTSVTHIETHYGHFDDDMLKQTALQNFSVNADGLSYTL